MDLLLEANRLASILANQFKKTLLTEEAAKKKIVIAYSGQFQPFHSGHYQIYETLVKKFGVDNVYITTPDEQNSTDLPMTFDEKKKLITTMFDINESKIHKVDNLYVPKDVLSHYDSNSTSFVTVLSVNDAAPLSKSKYFHRYVDGESLQPYKKAGYYLTIPELTMKVGNQSLSNPQIMQILGSDKTKPETKKKLFVALYKKSNEKALDFISKSSDGATDVDGGFDKTQATGKKNSPTPNKTQATGQDNTPEDDDSNDKTPPMQRMVVNPETGREIKVQSALKYPRWKPVYKKAEKVLQTHGIDRKDRVKEPEVNTRYKKRAAKMNKESLATYLGDIIAEELLENAAGGYINVYIENLGNVKLHVPELLTEGGAAGHLSHPYEDPDLKFSDLKNMISRGLSGGLDKEAPVTEKLDGQNIQFSYKNGKVIFARNAGHVKNSGETALDVTGIRDKFAGRGEIETAFTSAAEDLDAAVKALPAPQRDDMFRNGSKWINLEIINPKTQNVIPYDKNILVFHNTVEYDANGDVVKLGQDEGSLLANMMQKVGASKQKAYGIQGPQNIAYSDKDDSTYKAKEQQYLHDLENIRKAEGLSDNSTLGELYLKKWKEYIDIQAKQHGFTLSDDVKTALARRWGMGDKVGAGARQFKKDNPELVTWFSEVDKKSQKINKDIRKPVEYLFLKVGADSLVRMTNFMSANNPIIADKLKGEVLSVIKTLKENPGNASELLQRELERLETIGFDKITPSEGVVFIYNGKPYKFTGTFAPVNQLMGTLRFKRGGDVPAGDKLYLDDTRPTPQGYNLRAYTAQEAIEMLKKGTVSEISFDHDLGPAEAGTGYDVAKWIEEEAHTDPNFKMPQWQVHSANPVGAKNIERAMESAERGAQRIQSAQHKQAPVVVYPGRFQPFHPGHYSVYKSLVDKYGKDNVYIATSDKTDGTESPFNFNQKKKIMSMFEIPQDKIVQVKNPYAPTEILDKYPEDTPYMTVLSDKDADRLTRGGAMGYYQPAPNGQMGGYKKVGYFTIAPELNFNVDGENVSGTRVREVLKDPNTSIEQKQAMFRKIYGRDNPEVFDMMTHTLEQSTAQKKQAPKSTLRAAKADKKAADNVPANLAGKKVHNPETDNDILVKTALGYDKDHPAHQAAEKVVRNNRS